MASGRGEAPTIAAAPLQAPRRTPAWRVWLAFAVVCAIWGSTFLVISFGDEALPPLWAATLRLMLAALVLFPLALVVERRLPRGAALRAALAFGALNFGVQISLLYWSEARFPSGLTAVLYGTNPLSTALMARAMGLERLHPGKLLGAVVALGGVSVIFAHIPRTGADPVAGGLLLIAATVAGLSTLVLKRGPRQAALGANAVATLPGCAICFAGSLLLREPHAMPASAAAWWPLLYLVVAGSVTAFVLMVWLLQHWPATRASFVSVVTPLVALTLGAGLRHEHVGRSVLLGTVLVIGGLVLGLWASAPGRAAPAPRR